MLSCTKWKTVSSPVWLLKEIQSQNLFLLRQRFAVFRWLSHSWVWKYMPEDFQNRALPEKCPNTEFFLVRIFPHSDLIWNRKNYEFGYFWRSGDLDAFDKGDDDQQLSTFETINSVTILKIKFWSFTSYVLINGSWASDILQT